MSAPTLQQVLAEALALGGGNMCASGHDWLSAGGRACPYGCNSSQTVYECLRCGEIDYGAPWGPGHAECNPMDCCDGLGPVGADR